MKYLTTVLLGVAVLGSTMYFVDKALAMPDVWFSYATNECVKVVNYTDEIFSCETLPSKFHHVWVQ